MQKINYARLGEAQLYYEDKKYSYIETPWMVTEQIDAITKPHGIQSNIVANKDKVLLASGEQAFLYQYLKGYLPKGDFQTITPCFRNEPYDMTHSKVFMKLELISTSVVDKPTLEIMIRDAFNFFLERIPDPYKGGLKIVETGRETYDIELYGIELGSYGIRSCEFLDWVYGTGLAEPRFSNALEMIKKL